MEPAKARAWKRRGCLRPEENQARQSELSALEPSDIKPGRRYVIAVFD